MQTGQWVGLHDLVKLNEEFAKAVFDIPIPKFVCVKRKQNTDILSNNRRCRYPAYNETHIHLSE